MPYHELTVEELQKLHLTSSYDLVCDGDKMWVNVEFAE